MGELAGGMGAVESSAKGRGFLGSQPRLSSLPATQFCSRTICFPDVDLEHGRVPEASVKAASRAAPSEARSRCPSLTMQAAPT